MFIGKKVADASAVIAYYKNEVFLQNRSNKSGIFYPKFWGCFGGAKKINETFVNAAIREFKEETSITIKKNKLITFFKMNFFSKIKLFNFSRIFFLFHVKDKKEFKKNFILGEGKMGRFFNFRQYIKIKNIVPYDKFVIDLFFHKFK
jgi:ADP-ribose pyrophosphatase YjhB (NUDIX family)